MMTVENSSNQDKNITKSTASGQKTAQLNVFFLDSAKGFGATQQQLLDLALHLREQGYAPHICCPQKSMLMQKAHELGLNCQAIMGENSKKPSLTALMRIFWQQKRSKPICIHSFAEDCLPFAYKLARLRLINATLILHSCFDNPKRDGKALPAYWNVPKKIIYPSKYAANLWAEAGVDPAQSATIHTAHACLKSNEDSKNKRWVFVALEDLHEDSGLDFLLKAMSALWQHPYLPEWEVRIVGKGAKFEEIFQEAQSLGVSSRLALLGEQPLENILPYAHVVISPYIGPHGNISALMAAWSAELPLICTTVNAHMEVAHAGNAYTVPAVDPQRLASAMIELMCRPERMEHCCNLSTSMKEYANISRMLNQYTNLYQDCIARHGWVLPLQGKAKEQE